MYLKEELGHDRSEKYERYHEKDCICYFRLFLAILSCFGLFEPILVLFLYNGYTDVL